MTIQLKRPKRSYQPRLYKFLQNMIEVKNLEPFGFHLWKVMDTSAFEDTETALETTLFHCKITGPTARRKKQARS
jgi:hypothetical protein